MKPLHWILLTAVLLFAGACDLDTLFSESASIQVSGHVTEESTGDPVEAVLVKGLRIIGWDSRHPERLN